MKKVVVTVTNDLSNDQRVQRSIDVWQNLGYQPTFIGRQLPDSKPFNPSYPVKRFKLPFTKGFAFYASYNLALFFYLLKNRFNAYHSNDLDTLLPNYLASRIFSKPLIYDSHEYFCGVPEIADRPLVKAIWQGIERFIFPKLKTIITVNASIARLYQKEYGKKIWVVRNIANAHLPKPIGRKALGLPPDGFIVLNQGSGINVDRGMEEMLNALPLLPPDVFLLLVGKGDVIPKLKSQVKQLQLSERVIFIPPQNYHRLLQYTQAADLGLSLDKDTNLNYRYSLPNKLFDYIKCGLPVVCSPLVELKNIVEYYHIGRVTTHEPEAIAQAILAVKANGKKAYQANLVKAAQENNWAHEQKILKEALLSALP
jgi:glycosyltransferase involved in cell wall biosynthesis